MCKGIVGVGVETQQLRQFTTQVDQLPHNLHVVVGVVVRTHRVVGHIHLLPQLTTGRVGEERRVGGGMKREHIAFHILLLGCMSSQIDGTLGQSFQVFLIRDMEGEVVGVLQFVLGELQGEYAQFS